MKVSSSQLVASCWIAQRRNMPTASQYLNDIQFGVAIFFGVLNALGFLLTASVATRNEYIDWSQQVCIEQSTATLTTKTAQASTRTSSIVSISFLKQVLTRFKKYRGIYVTAIIHCADVITDYLVLVQYILFAIDEWYGDNKENINYTATAIASFLAIVFSRILSSYYIYKFTTNKLDVLLNTFDLYIFREIIASHETGNKTDLMQFLQKIEKIFESGPQVSNML